MSASLINTVYSVLGGGKFMTSIPKWRSDISLLAEDVLGDLGVRQAIRGMPKNARL